MIGCQHLPDGGADRDHHEVGKLSEEEGQQRPAIRRRNREERERGSNDDQESRGHGSERQTLGQPGDRGYGD